MHGLRKGGGGGGEDDNSDNCALSIQKNVFELFGELLMVHPQGVISLS